MGSCLRRWSERLAIGALLAATLALAPSAAQAAPAAAADGNDAADWFAFTPPRDQFGPSVLDLRTMLNEPVAGSHGRIAAKDGDLVFSGTGQKVRFWGVVSEPWIWPTDKAQIDYMARRLAKQGVNLVRLHIARGDGPPTRFLDTVQYTVHALKQQGVYSYLSWFCTACYGDRTNRLYFDPEAQQEYMGWVHTILGSPNPYTGMPLGKDPAVACIELIDEDSLFFWTFNPERADLKGRMPLLEKLFGDWLKANYGSLDKAVAAWGPGKYPDGDNFAAGRVAMYNAGALTGADWAIAGRNEKRAEDQARFMTETMRKLVRRHEGVDPPGHRLRRPGGRLQLEDGRRARARPARPVDQPGRRRHRPQHLRRRRRQRSAGRLPYQRRPDLPRHLRDEGPRAGHPHADPVRRHAPHHDRGRLGSAQPLPRRGAVTRRRLLLAAGHRRLLPLPRPARLVPEPGQVAHPGARRHGTVPRPPASSTAAATSRRAPSSSTTP